MIVAGCKLLINHCGVQYWYVWKGLKNWFSLPFSCWAHRTTRLRQGKAVRHKIIFSCIVFPEQTSNIERKVALGLCSAVPHTLVHINELKPVLWNQCLWTLACKSQVFSAPHQNILLILKLMDSLCPRLIVGFWGLVFFWFLVLVFVWVFLIIKY